MIIHILWCTLLYCTWGQSTVWTVLPATKMTGCHHPLIRAYSDLPNMWKKAECYQDKDLFYHSTYTLRQNDCYLETWHFSKCCATSFPGQSFYRCTLQCVCMNVFFGRHLSVLSIPSSTDENCIFSIMLTLELRFCHFLVCLGWYRLTCEIIIMLKVILVTSILKIS